MPHSEVTVVVVPRERFSYAPVSLESLLASTPEMSELVYVDCGSPAPIHQRLRARVAQFGFTYVRVEQFVSPNRARNLGLARVRTKFLVFVDNDVIVSPGWLEPLLACARETGARIVGPLYLIEVGGKRSIHMAGGDAHIAQEGGRRVCFERHRHGGAPPALGATLDRVPCELVEFHTMLVLTRFLEESGGLDERLLSLNEHVDLCMQAREAGYAVYFEPRSVVTYVPSMRLSLSDVPYFMLRWSESWNRATAVRFNAKWNLDETHRRNRAIVKFGRHHRCRGLGLISDRVPPSPPLRLRRRILVLAERCLNIGYTTSRQGVRRLSLERRRWARREDPASEKRLCPTAPDAAETRPAQLANRK